MLDVLLKSAIAGLIVFMASVVAMKNESLAGILMTAPIITFSTFYIASSEGVDLTTLSMETLKALVATAISVLAVFVVSKYFNPTASLLISVGIWLVVAGMIYALL